MTPPGAIASTLLAVAGLVAAVLLGVVVGDLTSQSVGITAEPPSISEDLVDRSAAIGQSDRAGGGRDAERASAATGEPALTQAAPDPVETPPPTSAVDPEDSEVERESDEDEDEDD